MPKDVFRKGKRQVRSMGMGSAYGSLGLLLLLALALLALALLALLPLLATG